MNPPATDVGRSLHAELEATRRAFHALVDSLSDEHLTQPSLNSGWTNGEVLFHILLGFVLLEPLGPMARFFGRLPRFVFKPFAWVMDALTGPFNWINALGARGGARVYDRRRLLARYDRVHDHALAMIASVGPDEWERGMYYPARWDPLFSGFMTVEQVFRFPILHYEVHAAQIAR